MNLFSDDPAPLGFSSASSCPVDSYHLERSYDLLRYHYDAKRLGVPSVVDSDIRIVTHARGQPARGTLIQTTIHGSPSSLVGSPTLYMLDRRFLGRRRFNYGGSGSDGSGDSSGSDDDSHDGSPGWFASMFVAASV